MVVANVNELLHVWRERVLGLTKAEFSRKLAGIGIPPGTWEVNLSRYETTREKNHRRPNREILHQIDVSANAGGAIVDLARAIGTPNVFSPSKSWAHNFQPPHGPNWIWIRFPQPSPIVEVQMRCGAFSLFLNKRIDDEGIFVTAPYSTSTPPILVKLSEPGWVNFGRGVIPEALGFELVSGLEEASRSERLRRFVESVTRSSLTEGQPWKENVRSFLGIGSKTAVATSEVVMDYPTPISTSPMFGEEIDRNLTLKGEWLNAIRLSEGMSLREVANLATELDPSSPVSHTTIQRLEEGKHVREFQSINLRLDTIYGADGRTCLTEGFKVGGSNPPQFVFPTYWVGPVWLELKRTKGNSTGDVHLKWGGWQRKFKLTGNVILSFRKCERKPHIDPLLVLPPLGWTVKCGVGWPNEVTDINDDWMPSTAEFMNLIFLEVKSTVNQAFENRGQELQTFLDSLKN